MAFPTALNSQITDSVTQANLKVLGDAPAMGLGDVYVATSQALSNAAHNSTLNQQQSTVTMHAASTKGLSTLYSADTGSSGVATNGVRGLDWLLIPGLDIPTRGLAPAVVAPRKAH